MLQPNTKISRNKEFVSSVLDGEIVLMSIENGKYYSMNGTGGRIWELVEATKSISEIIADLQQEYQMNHDVSEKEVIAFVEELVSEKILVTIT